MTSVASLDVRADYTRAARGFGALVNRVGPDQWSGAGLGDWSVRDLVGHTSRALVTVESYLRTDQSLAGRAPDLAGAADYYAAARRSLADPAAVAQRGRDAGEALGDDPAGAVAGIVERVLTLVSDAPDDALVETPAGSMSLIGYLPSRTFELVVHGLDLAAAVDVEAPAALLEATPGCLRLAVDLASVTGSAPDVLLALTGRRPLGIDVSVV